MKGTGNFIPVYAMETVKMKTKTLNQNNNSSPNMYNSGTLCAQWDVAVPKFGQAPSSGCDWLLPNWVTWTSVHARLETFLALALRKLCRISFKNFSLKSLWRSLQLSLASLMASSQNCCWQRLYSFCINNNCMQRAEKWDRSNISEFVGDPRCLFIFEL